MATSTSILRRAALAVAVLSVVVGALWAGRPGRQAPAPCAAPSVEGATCGYSAPAAAGATEAAGSGPFASATPVVVEVLSRSCAACRRMEPVVEEASHRCAGPALRVERRFVDDAEGAAWARSRGVFGIPTFLLLDGDGREVRRLVGEQPLANLEGAMQSLSGGRCRS